MSIYIYIYIYIYGYMYIYIHIQKDEKCAGTKLDKSKKNLSF